MVTEEKNISSQESLIDYHIQHIKSILKMMLKNFGNVKSIYLPKVNITNDQSDKNAIFEEAAIPVDCNISSTCKLQGFAFVEMESSDNDVIINAVDGFPWSTTLTFQIGRAHV